MYGVRGWTDTLGSGLSSWCESKCRRLGTILVCGVNSRANLDTFTAVSVDGHSLVHHVLGEGSCTFPCPAVAPCHTHHAVWGICRDAYTSEGFDSGCNFETNLFGETLRDGKSPCSACRPCQKPSHTCFDDLPLLLRGTGVVSRG